MLAYQFPGGTALSSIGLEIQNLFEGPIRHFTVIRLINFITRVEICLVKAHSRKILQFLLNIEYDD